MRAYTNDQIDIGTAVQQSCIEDGEDICARMCNNFHDTWTRPKLILLSVDDRLHLLEGKGYVRNYTYICALIQKNKQGGNGSGYRQEWMEMGRRNTVMWE